MSSLPSWALGIKIKFINKMQGDDELLLKECPNCGNIKWNFQINLVSCVCHCWVCNYGASVRTFLKWQDIDFEEGEISPARIQVKEKSKIALPLNIPLSRNYSRICSMARARLDIRGVMEKVIEEWDMRIVVDDDNFGELLVPFYGLKGLEYYICWRFLHGSGYRLPKRSKDNWVPKRRGSDSIVLVEGLFDGLNVWKNTSYDILILCGTYLLDYQTEMLKKTNYKKVYICLDGEALEEASKLANRLFKTGVRVYLTKLPWDKDPHDIGEEIKNYLDKSIKVNMTTKSRIKNDLLRMKNA